MKAIREATASTQRKAGAKKKSKPSAAASSRGSQVSTRAGSSLSIFSPSNLSLVPTLLNSGKAFPVSSMVRLNFTVDPGSRYVIIMSHCPTAPNMFMYGRTGFGVTAPPTWLTRSAPTLLATPLAGGPTSGRTMKAGMTVVNATNALNAGGRVFVLNSDQRFVLGADPESLTPTQFTNFLDEIVAHPKAREFSGADFVKGNAFHSHVVDAVNYEQYGDWRGQISINDYFEGFAVWPDAVASRRSMSTLIMVIESPTIAQSYTVSARASWYTRWPLNTVLGQSMRDVPTADARVINGHITRAERTATDPDLGWHTEYM